MRIAPSQKEETLTPRCPRTKAYRAVAKRRSAYAAMLVLSVLSAPSVRAVFLIFGTNKTRVSRRSKKKKRLRRDAPAQKRIAPSQKEGALTP